MPNAEQIVYSISDANRRMERWTAEDEENAQLPEKILTAIRNEEDNKTICGSADEYHNLLSEYARKGLPSIALEVAKLGIRLYPQNIDLLSDGIKFASETQDWETCQKIYQRLLEIPKDLWNWRAFTFCIDYLKERFSVENDLGRDAVYNEALALVEDYKKLILWDERAWVAEAELYLVKNRVAMAIEALENGVKNIEVAPQCCLKLSDLYLARGEYEKVIKYSAIGARATAQDQPTASTGYFYYISALAKDALIHKSALENPDDKGKGFHNSDTVKDALIDYDIADTIFRNQNRTPYIGTIWMRKTILMKKSGLEEKGQDLLRNLLELRTHEEPDKYMDEE